MNPSNLTNYQLYEIIQNSQLDKRIRDIANEEFNNRKLSIDQIQQIIARHDSLFKKTEESLSLKYKTLLVIFPFFIPIQSINAAKFLANGQKRKWKEYWFYISLGYLLWTVLIILFFRFFVFSRK
jgi:hypothetical protein